MNTEHRRIRAARPLRRAAAAIAALLALPLAACSSTTNTASYPNSSTKIEWVVPSAAGAGNDILARIIAPALEKELGAPVQVVNKEGGNQVIGLNYLANAKKDGQTMGFTNIPSILGRYLDPTKQASFKRDSFAPIGSFATNDVVIGVNKASKFGTIKELFDAVKAEPGKISAATDSRGGDDHVNLRILEKELGLDFNIVHYNSGADKVAAMIAGEVDFAIGGLSSFVGSAKSGESKILAVINDSPNKLMPELPTMKSAGYTVEPMSSNFAVSLPAGTPPQVISALEAALKKAVEQPEVTAKLTDAGTGVIWRSSQEVADLWQKREAAVKPIIDELLKEGQ